MHDPAPDDGRLFLRHAGGIRALAFELLGDRQAAEDVLQDTFVRALSAPPASRERLGGWLREVARGLALNRHRGEARRRAREHAAAQDERSTPHDGPERAETLRLVTDSVLALDEPYRTVVLLRYFEGLPPREIARQRAQPLATVTSQLARAHAELRTRLERRFRGRSGGLPAVLGSFVGERAVAAASGAAAAGGAGGTWSGILIMSSKSLAAAAAGMLALVLVLWLLLRQEPPALDAQGGLATAATEGAARELHDLEAQPATPEARHAAQSTAPIAALAPLAGTPTLEPGPHLFELTIVARDGAGATLAGAEVLGAPEGQPLVRLGRTGWDGELRLHWRGFAAELPFVLTAEHESRGRSDLRSATLRAGLGEHVELALVVAPPTPGTFLLSLSFSALRGATEQPVSAPETEFRLDEAGNGVFVDPYLGDRPSAGVPILDGLPMLGALFVRPHLGPAPVAELADAPQPSPTGAGGPDDPERATLRLRVLDAAGRPVADAVVELATRALESRPVGVTDEQGRVEFADQPSGAALVTLAGGEFGRLERRLDLAPGVAQHELRLASGALLRARLADEQGLPLRGWCVLVWSVDGREFLGSATSSDEGLVSCRLAGPRPVRIEARPHHEPRVPALLLADRAWPADSELALRVRHGNQPASLNLPNLVDARGTALDEAVVRLWSPDRRSAIELGGEHGAEQRMWSAELVPGSYELEVGAPQHPWTQLGRVELPPHATIQLGTRRLGAPGRVEWLPPDPAGAERVVAVFEQRRHGARVVSAPTAFVLPAVRELPPGVTRVHWTRHALVARLPSSAEGLADGHELFEFAEQGTAQHFELTLDAAQPAQRVLEPLPPR